MAPNGCLNGFSFTFPVLACPSFHFLRIMPATKHKYWLIELLVKFTARNTFCRPFQPWSCSLLSRLTLLEQTLGPNSASAIKGAEVRSWLSLLGALQKILFLHMNYAFGWCGALLKLSKINSDVKYRLWLLQMTFRFWKAYLAIIHLSTC